jgi:hypothetical protein
MAKNLYFVVALTEAQKVRERIQSVIAESDRYELAVDKWFVSYDGVGQDLAETAGIRSGDQRLGTGLVMPITTYSGRAPTTLWDWLKTREA